MNKKLEKKKLRTKNQKARRKKELSEQSLNYLQTNCHNLLNETFQGERTSIFGSPITGIKYYLTALEEGCNKMDTLIGELICRMK